MSYGDFVGYADYADRLIEERKKQRTASKARTSRRK